MLTTQSKRFRWFVVCSLSVVALIVTAATQFIPATKIPATKAPATTAPITKAPAIEVPQADRRTAEREVAAPMQQPAARVVDANIQTVRHESAALAKPSTALAKPSTSAAAKLKTKPKSRAPRRETVARLKWHTDYAAARREAERKGRMLVINFLPDGDSAAQRELEQKIKADLPLRDDLRDMVLARLPIATKVEVEGKKQPLLEQSGFEELRGEAGVAILDFKHEDEPFYGDVVTVLPFADGKYYRWKTSHLKSVLDLPAGTITQRTMIWAVRIHPENPASTKGEFHPVLAEAAKDHSAYQARVGVQGHQNFLARYQSIRSEVDAGTGSEVVAESWKNQGMIDSCLDCVRSWRYSPGHWGAVRREHDKYGYDIRRSRRGIWYGTGIFAD